MDVGLINAGYGAVAGAIEANTANAIAGIRTSTSNRIRAINNETAQHVAARNAKLTGLQRWAQGVRNSRVYESVAQHQEASATNFNRIRDQRTRGNFAANVQEAEQAGRIAAGAAASGVTGSVVDIIDQTAKLKAHLEGVARDEADEQFATDAQKAEARQRAALLDNLDYSLIFDQPALLDFRSDKPQTTSVFAAALGGVGKKGFQSVAGAAGSFFNTPPDNSLIGRAGSGNQGLGD